MTLPGPGWGVGIVLTSGGVEVDVRTRARRVLWRSGEEDMVKVEDLDFCLRKYWTCIYFEAFHSVYRYRAHLLEHA
jgi:hypothetical protein